MPAPEIPHGWREIANSFTPETDWRLFLAIGIHESGWGESPYVTSHHNPFGIKRNGKIELFASLAAAFEGLAFRTSGRHPRYKEARRIYDAEGLSRRFLEAFGSVYCPTETRVWVDDVEALITQISAQEALRVRG